MVRPAARRDHAGDDANARGSRCPTGAVPLGASHQWLHARKHHERDDRGQHAQRDGARARDPEHHDRHAVREANEQKHRHRNGNPLGDSRESRCERRDRGKQRRPDEEVARARRRNAERETDCGAHDDGAHPQPGVVRPLFCDRRGRQHNGDARQRHCRGVQPPPLWIARPWQAREPTHGDRGEHERDDATHEHGGKRGGDTGEARRVAPAPPPLRRQCT